MREREREKGFSCKGYVGMLKEVPVNHTEDRLLRRSLPN